LAAAALSSPLDDTSFDFPGDDLSPDDAFAPIPTRGFTAAVSVFRPSTPRVARRSGLTLSLSKGFRGTPPAKPFICKPEIRLVRRAEPVFRSWADPIGEASLLVLAKFNLSPEDITRMSLCSCSQIFGHLSLLVSIPVVLGK
jgi:hypothetical protein